MKYKATNELTYLQATLRWNTKCRRWRCRHTHLQSVCSGKKEKSTASKLWRRETFCPKAVHEKKRFEFDFNQESKEKKLQHGVKNETKENVLFLKKKRERKWNKRNYHRKRAKVRVTCSCFSAVCLFGATFIATNLMLWNDIEKKNTEDIPCGHQEFQTAAVCQWPCQPAEPESKHRRKQISLLYSKMMVTHGFTLSTSQCSATSYHASRNHHRVPCFISPVYVHGRLGQLWSLSVLTSPSKIILSPCGHAWGR